MKQYLYILCFATIALLWGSCDKNETPVFDTSYSAINIWFGTESSVLDSVTYNYSYTLEKDDKGLLTLKITNPDKFWSISKYLVIQVK